MEYEPWILRSRGPPRNNPSVIGTFGCGGFHNSCVLVHRLRLAGISYYAAVARFAGRAREGDRATSFEG